MPASGLRVIVNTSSAVMRGGSVVVSADASYIGPLDCWLCSRFPLVMLVAAPAIAFAIFERGLPPELTESKALAEKVGAAWHSVTEAPLRYVGGSRLWRCGLCARPPASSSRVGPAGGRPTPKKRDGIDLLRRRAKLHCALEHDCTITCSDQQNRDGIGANSFWPCWPATAICDFHHSACVLNPLLRSKFRTVRIGRVSCATLKSAAEYSAYSFFTPQ